MGNPARARVVLVLGDAIIVLLTTLGGFARHGELATAGWIRIAAAVLPFTAAWFAVSPWLGCFDDEHARAWRGLWRPPLAALMAAPLGAIVRGLWLQAPVIPVFAVVMGAVIGVAMLAWRALATFLLRTPSRQGP